MKSISTKKMQELDRIAIKRYRIPSLILMENAGRGIAGLAQEILSSPKSLIGDPNIMDSRLRGNDRRKHKILVICGKGNNGGDGFVAARHLANRGYLVNVITLAKANELKDDPKTNYTILQKMGVPIKHIASPNQLKKLNFHKTDLIIDGIFGIGLSRPVSGLLYDVISAVNESKKPVLSIDVPSGLNSDSGEIMGIAICADVTGTLGAAKRGLLVGKGRKLSGKITVLDISIPRRLL